MFMYPMYAAEALDVPGFFECTIQSWQNVYDHNFVNNVPSRNEIEPIEMNLA